MGDWLMLNSWWDYGLDIRVSPKFFDQVGHQTTTHGLIETFGSMVIFYENQGVSDLSKYEFQCSIYVKTIKFLVIWQHFDCFYLNILSDIPSKSTEYILKHVNFTVFGITAF